MKNIVKFTKVAHKLNDKELEGVREEIEKYNQDVDTIEVMRKSSAIETIETIEKAIPKNPKLEEGSRTVVKYVSTRTVDQSGDIVIPKGVSYKRFLDGGAPVFFQHNYSLPQIARDEEITTDAWGIKVKQRYADTGEGTLADIMWRLTQQDMNKQSSVGLLPLEVLRLGEDGFQAALKALKLRWPELAKSSKNCRRIIVKSLLFEHSDVGLGDNTDTEILAVSKQFINAGANDVLLKQLGLPLIEKAIDEPVIPLIVENPPEKIEENTPIIDDKSNNEEQPGQPEENTATEKEVIDPKEELIIEPKETPIVKEIQKTTLVKEPQIVKMISKPYIKAEEINKMVAKEVRKKLGRLV